MTQGHDRLKLLIILLDRLNFGLLNNDLSADYFYSLDSKTVFEWWIEMGAERISYGVFWRIIPEFALRGLWVA
jgi:hypothetical protein